MKKEILKKLKYAKGVVFEVGEINNIQFCDCDCCKKTWKNIIKYLTNN